MQADQVTRAEVLGALSYAQDLAEGQPPGHVVRTAALAGLLAERMGWDEAARADLLHAALLKDAGCSSNAARLAWVLGADDRRIKPAMKLIDWTRLPDRARFAARIVMPSAPVPRRFARLAWLATATDLQAELSHMRCERGADIAAELGFDSAVAGGVRELDEHWDGNGRPKGLTGEDISPIARVLCLAQTFEVFERVRGSEAAWAIARERSGRWFEPALVDALGELRGRTAAWREPQAGALALELGEAHPLPADEAWLDRIAEGFAQVIDAKSPYTAAHSRRVAHLAGSMADALGLADAPQRELRRAALLHDIGKLGLSNRILDKRGPLDAEEMAQVREHPRHTERILGRVRRFARLAEDAAAHHERLDGSGYPHGLRAEQLGTEARMLAVADVYEALTSDRPYRPARTPAEALGSLEREAGRTLDGDAVAALRRTVGEEGGL